MFERVYFPDGSSCRRNPRRTRAPTIRAALDFGMPRRRAASVTPTGPPASRHRIRTSTALSISFAPEDCSTIWHHVPFSFRFYTLHGNARQGDFTMSLGGSLGRSVRLLSLQGVVQRPDHRLRIEP